MSKRQPKPLLIVRNWGQFQHYKNRRPPWLKLHRTLLENMDFCNLPIEAKAVLPLVWILASESGDIGSVPYDLPVLSFRMRLPADQVAFAVAALVHADFLEFSDDASNVLASCYQVASAETERETEREADLEGEKAPYHEVTIPPTKYIRGGGHA